MVTLSCMNRNSELLVRRYGLVIMSFPSWRRQRSQTILIILCANASERPTYQRKDLIYWTGQCLNDHVVDGHVSCFIRFIIHLIITESLCSDARIPGLCQIMISWILDVRTLKYKYNLLHSLLGETRYIWLLNSNNIVFYIIYYHLYKFKLHHFIDFSHTVLNVGSELILPSNMNGFMKPPNLSNPPCSPHGQPKAKWQRTSELLEQVEAVHVPLKGEWVITSCW